MSLWSWIRARMVGGHRRGESGPVRSAPTETGSVVTDCRLWKCPNCGVLLERAGLGTVWQAGDPLARVAGTSTCTKCGAEFPQADVYGGRYDSRKTAVSARRAEIPDSVSVVVFCIRSFKSPDDSEAYCRRVIGRKYARSQMLKHYVVGFADDLTVNEALVLYEDHVRAGNLPDLGQQFDSIQGAGPDGRKVIALLFA